MKEKLLYRAPQVYWSDLLANEIICISTDIEDYDYTVIDWNPTS